MSRDDEKTTAPKFDKAEREAVEKALAIGAREEHLRNRSSRLGTSVGASEFTAAVAERVKDRIAEYPALARTVSESATQVVVRAADAKERSQPVVKTERDPVLEKEPTTTLLAARLVGIERERSKPDTENKARVEVIEHELKIRRSEGKPVQSLAANLDDRDFSNGSRLLNNIKVEKAADPAKRSNARERGDMER